jgi:hypothetical protein
VSDAYATDNAKPEIDPNPHLNGAYYQPPPSYSDVPRFQAAPPDPEPIARARPGLDLRRLINRSREWARIQGQDRATITHQLMAATGVAASQLEARGVQAIADLRNGLFQDCDTSTRARAEPGTVGEDNGALAVLEHACGYAREAGRDEASIDDWLDALFDRLARSKDDSPGLRRLRSHCVVPEANAVEPYVAGPDIAAQVARLQASVDGLHAKLQPKTGMTTGTIMITVAVLLLGALVAFGAKSGWFLGSLLYL